MTETSPSDGLRIRPARPEDRNGVFPFTRDTFEWGDYIPEVWDEWLADPSGQTMVATLDGRPVGVCRVQLASADEAWLQGMRVHPDHRRRGIATALNEECRRYAAEQDRRIVRLATSSENLQAQGQIEDAGFYREATFIGFRAPPGPQSVPSVRLARAADLDEIRARWTGSDVLRASDGLFPAGWVWRKMSWTDVTERVSSGRALYHPEGFALFREGRERLRVYWIDGGSSALTAMARSCQDWAYSSGLEASGIRVPDFPPFFEPIERVGYERQGALLIYRFDVEDPE